MAVMYFSVVENITDQYKKDYKPLISKTLITHAQKIYLYDEEHLTAEYGYPTRKRCEQEMRKMRKHLDVAQKNSYCYYTIRCEAHEVPDLPAEE